MHRSSLLSTAVLLAITTGAGAQTYQPPDPRDLIIYQIITDRFDDGNPANNTASPRGTYNPSSGGAINGGDFAGITRRLDYIRALGANAIWISPFLENTSGQYHGYATYNWHTIDPHFGTEAELVELISQAHARGISVFFDMIVNHCGNIIRDHGTYLTPPSVYTLAWNNSSFRYPAPFDSLTYFHAQGNINNWVQPEEVLGELSGLDDLKTETDYVRTNMISIWEDWIQRTGVDGFRIDTVKHVDLGFWQTFAPAIHDFAHNTIGKTNFYMFGEVYSGDDNFCRNYVSTFGGGAYTLDGVLDFYQYSVTNNVFATASSPTSSLTDRMNSKVAAYGANFDRIPTWLDSHDQARFLNVANGATTAEDHQRLMVASTYNFCAYGPPVLYYGTEQGFDGSGDPNNREDMYDGQFEQGPSLGDNFVYTTELYKHFQLLLRAREAYEPLRRGTFTVYGQNTTGKGLYVFARRYSGDEVLVALNSNSSAVTTGAYTTSFAPGVELVDALDPAGTTLTVGAGGVVGPVTLAGYAHHVMVPRGKLLATAPTVTNVLPAPGSTVTNPVSVILTFDSAMDQPSVEAGFSLASSGGTPVPGTMSWSPDGLQFVFQPSAELVSSANYTIRLSALARGGNGAPLTNPTYATFSTSRGPRDAILPASAGTVYFIPTAPVINGSGTDWPVSTTLPLANTSRVDSGCMLEYVDALDDDTGDGNYTYPSNSAFTAGDADLSEFRFAQDASRFYFYFKPKSVNPAASFFTPYYGVVARIDPWAAHQVVSAGIKTSTGETGRSDIDLSSIPGDFEVVYSGGNGAAYYLENVLQAGTTGAHSTSTGVMEISVPKPAGLPTTFDLVLFPYTGLETFSDMREVLTTSGSYDPGGANVTPESPDVFDLAGAAPADQVVDLSDYLAGGFRTRPVRSFLRVTVSQQAIPVISERWLLY